MCVRAADDMEARYHMVKQNMNWTDAGSYCHNRYKAKLVVIDSLIDHLRLQAYLESVDGQPN